MKAGCLLTTRRKVANMFPAGTGKTILSQQGISLSERLKGYLIQECILPFS